MRQKKWFFSVNLLLLVTIVLLVGCAGEQQLQSDPDIVSGEHPILVSKDNIGVEKLDGVITARLIIDEVRDLKGRLDINEFEIDMPDGTISNNIEDFNRMMLQRKIPCDAISIDIFEIKNQLLEKTATIQFIGSNPYWHLVDDRLIYGRKIFIQGFEYQKSIKPKKLPRFNIIDIELMGCEYGIKGFLSLTTNGATTPVMYGRIENLNYSIPTDINTVVEGFCREALPNYASATAVLSFVTKNAKFIKYGSGAVAALSFIFAVADPSIAIAPDEYGNPHVITNFPEIDTGDGFVPQYNPSIHIYMNTLHSYYSTLGRYLPSLTTRSQFYELLGLGSASEYYGTVEQNTLLLNALKEKGICPTTVEDLKEAIGFVEPLPIKEDASFKQDPGRASDPEMPEFVDLGFKKQGEEFRIKLFVFNPSDTNLVWLPNSGYGLWNNMKKNGFNEVPDFISVDYTTSPNNAWTIEIVAKIPSNPGKKTLTFRMSFNIDGRQFGSYLNYVVNILGLATDVGKNAPNQSEWQQLYYASGGEKEVGLPYDDCGGVLVHRVGSALFQDFATGKAGKGAFIRGDGVKAVHWVHGSIWEKYTSIASPIEKYGAPMTEEYSFNGKIRQDFERASFYFDKTNNQVTIIEYNGSNTQSTNPADYHCKWSSQTPANPVTIKAGNSATLRLRLLNLGPATWYSGTVNLGTARPQDRIPFYPRGTGWRQTGDANRILLFEPTVKPGEIGTFYFTISIPKTTKPGTYREYFRPVADNITWMEDYGIYWDIKVVK